MVPLNCKRIYNREWIQAISKFCFVLSVIYYLTDITKVIARNTNAYLNICLF